MQLADYVVAEANKVNYVGEKSVWDGILEEPISSPAEFKALELHEIIRKMTSKTISELSDPRLEELWRQTEIAIDYGYRDMGEADFDSYTGDKRTDLVIQVMALIYVDAVCKVKNRTNS